MLCYWFSGWIKSLAPNSKCVLHDDDDDDDDDEDDEGLIQAEVNPPLGD